MIKKAAHTLHLVSLLLALVGLALHAMMDGAALNNGGAASVSNLSLAVVIHRLGTGMMIWMMVLPVFGRKVAFTVLVFESLATVAGYLLSAMLVDLQGQYVTSVIQALIIGMLGHSLIYRSHGASHHH
jgi:hypothetical protein